MGKVRRLSNEEIREVLKRDELRAGLDSLSHWAKAHLENVVIGIVITAVSAFGIYKWSSGRSEGNTRAAIQLSGADQQMQNSLMGGGDLSQVTAAYQALQAEFAGREAGDAADLGLAHVAFEAKDFEKARAAYDNFAVAHPGSPLLSLALAGKAASLEALGKGKEAAEAYQSLGSNDKSGLASLAWMDAARLYEGLGDRAGAKACLEKLASLDKEGRLPESLKGRLKSLQARLKS